MTARLHFRIRPILAESDVDVVRNSDLFDAAWYRAQYPDVDILGMDPAAHYLWLGARMGRNPSPRFDAGAYLSVNRDVAEAGINPLLHFLRWGHGEGRWSVAIAAPEPVVADAAPASGRPKLNWVVNADNVGWAYGNNAKTLAAHLPDYQHVFDSNEPDADVALYFDIKIFKMRGVLGRRNVLRVGGPRPIELTYGDDTKRLEADLAAFDSVIVLNRRLLDLIEPLHKNVQLVPNALDLSEWAPLPARPARRGADFTVGFVGNLTTMKERHIKGFAYVEEACELLGVKLLHLGKGDGQIPREAMRERFYGQIDCLVHPVAAGKEGCSNVIMEALALGVPVITTPEAGFHAELIRDGEGIVYCRRDALDIAGKIGRLRDVPGLAEGMRGAARRFAEQHHDVRRTAPLYRMALTPAPGRDRRPVRAGFAPFWLPASEFASSRLRCEQPVALLSGSRRVEARLGIADDRDVVVVSQLASDETYRQLVDDPRVAVVYDVCDRYYADDRTVGGVHARTRFLEMVRRAELITCSTIALKREIIGLGLHRPVVYVPDGIDYRGRRDPAATPPDGPVVWFGNPGRGNFESSRWMIDHLMASGRAVKLITRRQHFRHAARAEGKPEYAAYLDVAVDWTPDGFVDELRSGGVCVLSHGPDESTKSPNRLVTAVSNGVPAVVATAPSCEALLRAGGMDYAIVADTAGLDAALRRLADPVERQRYLNAMQEVVERRFGDAAIREAYESLLADQVAGGGERRPIRTLFVSHNLNLGEGAPTSLLQTALGLKATYGIEPVVFSVLPGALEEDYRKAGIEVIVPELGAHSRLATKVIARTQEGLAARMREVIASRGIEAVVLNTATCLWFAQVSAGLGLPTIAIIRESSEEHVGFTFGPENVMKACREGLARADKVVFVSEHTRDLWQRRHALPRTAVIPNGIDLSHFDDIRALDKAEVRERLGVLPDGLLFVCVGSISRRKAQMDIVEAVASLPEELQGRIRLAFIGAWSAKYVEELEGRLAAAALRGRVQIVPETNEVALWYRAADAFVFASRNESYPRVIVEAMSFGLPIVTSAVFGTQEQVRHGECGLLFPAGDIPAMAAQIEALVTDDALRARLAQGASDRFWELVSYDEMVHRYYALVRRLHAGRVDRPAASRAVSGRAAVRTETRA